MSVKTDLECLIECLKYHQDDSEKAKDTVLTIASLTSTSTEAQNFLRTCGGLSFIVNILSTTEDENIKVAALYALGCAIERNVFSQTRLCTEAMFRFLYCHLSQDETPVQMKRTVTFLIMCLVTNNAKGQTMARKTRCVDALLQLFRKFPGMRLPYNQYSKRTDESEEPGSLELWMDVAGTLCGCVNNPQNDENQLVCASSIPAAMYIMSHTDNPSVLQQLSSFISLLTANNTVNQDRLHLLGGLDAIVTKLSSIVDSVMAEPDTEVVSAISNMITMLSSVTVENETNLETLSKLKVVPLLVKLLHLDVIDEGIKLKVIITLGCLVATNEESQKQVVGSDCVKLLISTMMTSQEEECVKAASMVLHSCVNAMPSAEIDVSGCVDKEESPTSDAENEENHHNSNTVPAYDVLNAKIQQLQKELQLERTLRKGLEDTLPAQQSEESDSSSSDTPSQGEDQNTDNATGQQETKPESATMQLTKEETTQHLMPSSPVRSEKSSNDILQLQERLKFLEQKFQSMTETVTDQHQNDESIDCKPTEQPTTSGSTSDSEANQALMEPESTHRSNIRQCGKKNEISADDTESDEKDAEKDKESPQFKVPPPPPPKSRCRPLQVVQGKIKVNKEEHNSKRRSHQQGTSAEGMATIQNHDLNIKNGSVRKLDQCPRDKVGPLPMKSGSSKSSEKKMSKHSSYDASRNGQDHKVGDVEKSEKSAASHSRAASVQTHHRNLQIPNKLADPESVRFDDSDVVSIADSAVSSLGIHLRHSIKPNRCNSSVSQHLPSNKLTLTPLRKCQNWNTAESFQEVAADCDPTEDVSVDDANDCRSKSPAKRSLSPDGTSTRKKKVMSTDDENVEAKLRKTPRVMLNKTSLKNKHPQMFTFDAENFYTNLDTSQAITVQTKPSSSKKDELGPQSARQKRKFYKRSGGSRKCYSVRYVKGKVQCSQLFRGKQPCSTGKSAAGSRSMSVYEANWTCPGCTPPRNSPLLDSHSLIPALKEADTNLCQDHGKLMLALTRHVRRSRRQCRR